MALLRERAARANGTALTHIPLKLPSLKTQDTAAPAFRQDPIDLVGLLVSRSGVAAATVRAHLAAFGLEARS